MRPTWEQLVELEPRLLELEELAYRYKDHEVDAWDGTAKAPVYLKGQLDQLVGWFRYHDNFRIEQKSAKDYSDPEYRRAHKEIKEQILATYGKYFRQDMHIIQLIDDVLRPIHDRLREQDERRGAGVLWTTEAWEVAARRILDILNS